MSGFQRYPTLPENADKVLFAEDFVNHILLRFKLPLLSSGIANRRAYIYNAFNSEVKLAANYVYRHFEDEIEEEFEDILKENNDTGISSFLKYAILLKFHTTVLHPCVSGAQNLMIFCVKISTIAVKFYMNGSLAAPALAVDYIVSLIKDINMVEGGWVSLNILAARYAQKLIEMDNLTPEASSDFDTENDSVSTLSSKNSEASCSPDHEMDVGDGQDEHPEEFSDSDHGNLCIAALNSPEEEPVSSISSSTHAERTNNTKTDNTICFSGNTSYSGPPGSSKESHASTSFDSFEVTSRGDDGSKQKIRKRQAMKPSYSRSKESDSDSDERETDLKRPVCIEPFDRQIVTEKRSAILSSPVNEDPESDSTHNSKTPDPDNFTSRVVNTSSMEEGGRVMSSHAQLSPLQKHVPKEGNDFDSKS